MPTNINDILPPPGWVAGEHLRWSGIHNAAVQLIHWNRDNPNDQRGFADVGIYHNPPNSGHGFYTGGIPDEPTLDPFDPWADQRGGDGGGGGGRGGGGGGRGGGGGGGGGGGASSSPGVAQSFHGQASLIDTNDPIYSLFAPEPWMSGMLSRGREYTQAATEDALRLQQDQATRSGVSSSSPAYLYMVAMQRRQQQQALAGALRDASLAWTLPAADRRAGALGQNAQIGTSVSMGNADADTRVSMANAGYATQSSIANAGNATQSSIAGGQLGLGYAQLAQQGSQFQSTYAQNASQQQFQNYMALLNMQSGGGGYVPPQGPDYIGAGLQGGNLGLSIYDRIRGYQGGGNNQPTYNPTTVTPNGGYAYNLPG